MEGSHVVALSGGKDSTAMALALLDREPRAYTFLCTPTGDELPDVVEHWSHLEQLLGSKLHRVTNRTLAWWIDEFKALPNWRQRWCTRLLKIEPCHAFIAALPQPVTIYVGLRADEPDRDGALYGGTVIERYPLREWGWALEDVLGYLKHRGIKVPPRTDCARCYYQRLGDWWRLWKEHPDQYESAVQDERATGHTFRSPGRDAWPASLEELRKEFERGKIPRDVKFQLPLFRDDEDQAPCRVCSL